MLQGRLKVNAIIGNVTESSKTHKCIYNICCIANLFFHMSEWIIFLYHENPPKIDHTIVKLSFVNIEQKNKKKT